MVFTSLPLCLPRIGLMIFRCSSTRVSESDSLFCARAVYPTISVNIIAANLRCPLDKLRDVGSPLISDKSIVGKLTLGDFPPTLSRKSRRPQYSQSEKYLDRPRDWAQEFDKKA